MSIEIMSLVLNHSKATGRAKLVLMGIANHQGDQGSWPSIATLARYANASESSVKRDLKTLVELGELKIELQAAPTNSQYKTNLYWVTLSGGSDDDVRGFKLHTSGGSPVGTQNIIKPLKETNVIQSKTEQRFIQFWDAYPHRNGDNKKRAKQLFSKLKTSEQESAIKGAELMANDPELPPKQFIPMAATWLNQERWNDTTETPTERREPNWG
jgi:hypothetical protein